MAESAALINAKDGRLVFLERGPDGWSVTVTTNLHIRSVAVWDGDRAAIHMLGYPVVLASGDSIKLDVDIKRIRWA